VLRVFADAFVSGNSPFTTDRLSATLADGATPLTTQSDLMKAVFVGGGQVAGYYDIGFQGSAGSTLTVKLTGLTGNADDGIGLDAAVLSATAPEPGSLALLTLGLSSVVGYSFRRRLSRH
jgi:hypothetical protein